ncbi:MAG: hypothetical protein LBF41_10060 [Deltaproteobacteria bacterium]|nr:hypothetical protein [Deltaproteobacteria bacterium]
MSDKKSEFETRKPASGGTKNQERKINRELCETRANNRRNAFRTGNQNRVFEKRFQNGFKTAGKRVSKIFSEESSGTGQGFPLAKVSFRSAGYGPKKWRQDATRPSSRLRGEDPANDDLKFFHKTRRAFAEDGGDAPGKRNRPRDAQNIGTRRYVNPTKPGKKDKCFVKRPFSSNSTRRRRPRPSIRNLRFGLSSRFDHFPGVSTPNLEVNREMWHVTRMNITPTRPGIFFRMTAPGFKKTGDAEKPSTEIHSCRKYD